MKEDGRSLGTLGSTCRATFAEKKKKKTSFSDVLHYHSFCKKKKLSFHSQVSPAGSKRPRHRRNTHESKSSCLLEAMVHAHIRKSAAYKYASTFSLLSSNCGVSMAGGCRSSSEPWDLHTLCVMGFLQTF